jgi:hypothetical protein
VAPVKCWSICQKNTPSKHFKTMTM